MKKTISIFFIIILSVFSFCDFDKGIDFYKNADYENSIIEFEKVNIKTDNIYYNIGNAHFRLGNTTKALKNYINAFYKNPGMKDNLKNIKFIDNTFNPIISYLFPFNMDILFILLYLSILNVIVSLYFKNYMLQNKKVLLYIGNIIAFTLIIYCFSILIIHSNLNIAISNSDIKGYSSPSDKGKGIAQFSVNTILYIEEYGTNYLKVKDSSGVSGWVNKDKVVIVENN
ncbi:MAG: hypothetical protein M0R46_02845 [Candidatus Muirbacterium halophilum]|nr:hypothetical protein [Candidatus Muirbacterium halophilum]MCK9474828.1 hypothetical protein [Candidatus Muirbacterium halophilum]